MSLQKIEQNSTHESLRLAHNEAVDTINTIQSDIEGVKNSSVKSGGDVTIESDGTMSVNDNSHNHTIDNVEGLEDALNNIDIPDAIIGSSTNSQITDAVNASLIELSLYGKSTQDGTPTPESPIEIVSVGDDGNVSVTTCGKNLLDLSSVKTMGGNIPESVTNGFRVNAKDNNSRIIICNCNLTVGKTYYLSYEYELENTTSSVVAYAKGSSGEQYGIGNKSFVAQYNFTEIRFYIPDTSVGDNVYFTVTNPQIELGTTKTDFVQFQGCDTAEITSGLPLCGIGDIRDELVYNADGTGKIIKRIYKVTFDGSDDEGWKQYSTDSNRITSTAIADIIVGSASNAVTAECMCDSLTVVTANNTYDGVEGLSVNTSGAIHICFDDLIGNTDLTVWTSRLSANPIVVMFCLASPQEVELTADEVSALMELRTFDGATNIYNDEEAEMNVKYWCDSNINSLLNNKAPLEHSHIVSDIIDLPEYSTGTSSTEGLTKLYDNTGTATDGTMTQDAITTAIETRVSVTGGIMVGALVAQSNSDYTVAQVRNVTMSTSAASGGSNGQIHYTYE